MKSFNERFFSTPHPTMYTRVGMSALALVFIGFFAGIWIDFFATQGVNFWVGLVAAPVMAFIHGWIILKGSTLEGRSRIPPNPISKLIVYTGGTLMLAACYHPAVTRLAPYALTKLGGEPYTERFVMWTDRGYGRRTCDYRLIGGPVTGLYADHLCISEDTYYRYPDQSVQVVLAGHRGPLGITVDDILDIGPVAP